MPAFILQLRNILEWIIIAWPSGQPWPLMGNVRIYEFTRSIGVGLLFYCNTYEIKIRKL